MASKGTLTLVRKTDALYVMEPTNARGLVLGFVCKTDENHTSPNAWWVNPHRSSTGGSTRSFSATPQEACKKYGFKVTLVREPDEAEVQAWAEQAAASAARRAADAAARATRA